ncbi:MAG: ceramidase domain-containing protein [Bacteroidia bacterium]|nr:ceramidase domain-containing protein [Bacteroidia bacterium]
MKDNKKAVWETGIFILVSLLAVLGIFWFQSLPQGGKIWEGMELAKAGLGAEYCEANQMEAVIRQPANSWSNLAYLFLGLMVWRFRPPQDKIYPLRSYRAFYGLLTASYVWLFAGSFFFHASLTRLGQQLDMGGTYSLPLALIGGALYCLRVGNQVNGNQVIKMGFLILVILFDLFCLIFKWHLNGKVMLPALIVVLVLLCGWLWMLHGGNRRTGLLLFGIIAMIVATVIRSLDVAKVGCNPDSWFQGHAVWHVLTGLSGYAVFKFLEGFHPENYGFADRTPEKAGEVVSARQRHGQN